MKYKNNEPLAKHSTQVHTTTDYFFFKSIDGNRNKNLLHINRIKESMSRNYLFTAIIVNEKHEIIDGQHRFDVIQELKLPLNYIVCTGYGINEVHILNQNSKTWNSDDYLDGYCNLGYPDYLKYKEFKDTYELGHTECQVLLSGITRGGGKRSMDAHVFFSGNFKIKNYNNACSIAEKILMIEPFYEGAKRRSFVMAMFTLLKNKEFEFTELIQKLKLQPTALVDCGRSEQYISLIEEIYNYRRREKVNLRYSA